MNRNSRKKED